MYTINGNYFDKIYEKFDNVPSNEFKMNENIGNQAATKNDLKDLINGLKNATVGDLYSYVKKDDFLNKLGSYMTEDDINNILNGNDFLKVEDLDNLNNEIRELLANNYTSTNDLPLEIRKTIKINSINTVTDLFDSNTNIDSNKKRILLNEICFTDLENKIFNKESNNVGDNDADNYPTNLIKQSEMICLNKSQISDIMANASITDITSFTI